MSDPRESAHLPSLTTACSLDGSPGARREPLLATQLLGIPAEGILHRHGPVAGAHGVILVHQRRAEVP